MNGDLILGIDLGTTNSVVAILEGDEPTVIPNAEGSLKTPSVVAIDDNGEIVVGEIARRQAATKPRQTVQSVKRLIGHYFSELDETINTLPYTVIPTENDEVRLKVGEREYSPQQISAEILKKLRKDAEAYLGRQVKQAIITVPAYFDDRKRSATKEAGELAGLDVLRLINEPTAAALAYGLGKGKGGITAIYDFGGGTFDISLLEIQDRTFEVIATDGDSRLGGDDIDALLTQRIVDEFYEQHGIDLTQRTDTLLRIKEGVEKAKCELSSVRQTSISLPFLAEKDGEPIHFEQVLSRTEFEEILEPLVEQSIQICERTLEAAKRGPEDIDRVILVGGTTRIPLVTQFVEEFFEQQPFKGVNPDEIVALGAAVQGGVLSGNLDEVVLLDVTPHSLGIETREDGYSKLVERNTTIPIKAAKTFTTTEENQEFVNIHVLQGEETGASENTSLGKFLLKGIEPAPPGQPRIRVSFQINADGILEITAQDLGSGSEKQLTISHAYLSEEERKERERAARRRAKLDRKKQDLQKHAGKKRLRGTATNKRSLGVQSPSGGTGDRPGDESSSDRQGGGGIAEAAGGAQPGFPTKEESVSHGEGFAVVEDDTNDRPATLAGIKSPSQQMRAIEEDSDEPSIESSKEAPDDRFPLKADRTDPADSGPDVVPYDENAPKSSSAMPAAQEGLPKTEPQVRKADATKRDRHEPKAEPEPSAKPAESQESLIEGLGLDTEPSPASAAEKKAEAPAASGESEEDGEMWSPDELLADFQGGDNKEILPDEGEAESAPVTAPANAAAESAPLKIKEQSRAAEVPDPSFLKPGKVELCPEGEIGESIKHVFNLLDAEKETKEALNSYDEVLPRLEQLAEVYPTDPFLHRYLAGIYLFRSQPNESLRHIRVLIDLPSDTVNDALKLLSKVIERFPSFTEARRVRAEIYSRQGKFEGAIKDVEQVLSRESGNQEMLEQLENIYIALLDTRYSAAAELKLVKVLLRQNKLDDAIKRLQKVVDDPQYQERARKVLGFCYWQKQMYYPAFQQFKTLGPTQEVKDILYRLANDLDATGDIPHSLEVMEFLAARDVAYQDVEQRLASLRNRAKQFQSSRTGRPVTEGGDLDTGSSPRHALKGSRFIILEELNRGSMGVVFKAKDTTLEDIVALKVLNDFLGADPMAIERFKREARAAKKLSHQRIVRINDLFEINEKKLLSMEFIEGRDLKRVLSTERTLPEEKIVKYIAPICEGLEYAHSQGVVHRDIKPANIMITSTTDEIKITDFGIAKNLQSEDMTTGSRILGTPLYMAPEQIEGKAVDARTDIYATGIMMYEMISGLPPYCEGNIEYQHVHNDPPPLPAGVSTGMAGIIMKCIAKRKEDRYRDAGHLRAALLELSGAKA